MIRAEGYPLILEKEDILALRSELQEQLDEFEYGRGAKHIYKLQGEERALVVYTRDILTEIIALYKRGKYYERPAIIEALEKRDWMRYSYSEKPGDVQCARERMKLRKSMSRIDVLMEQGFMLMRAKDCVIELLNTIGE